MFCLAFSEATYLITANTVAFYLIVRTVLRPLLDLKPPISPDLRLAYSRDALVCCFIRHYEVLIEMPYLDIVMV